MLSEKLMDEWIEKDILPGDDAKIVLMVMLMLIAAAGVIILIRRKES